MSDDSAVLILAGPTASGKTDLAIELALEYDAEIVGADSRQIYRGMPIATAVPTPQQLAAVPHHLVGFLDPQERYSAGRYAADALCALDDIRRRGKRAIVVGGTGFYIRALTGGVALAAEYDDELRSRLAREAATHPAEFLHAWLARHDAPRAESLVANDTYRVLRALEIALTAPDARSREQSNRTLAREGFSHMLVFLDVPLAVVDARISRRTEAMLRAGLIEEAERVGKTAIASTAVGYPQALAFLQGWSSEGELQASLDRATKRYARRQRSWFRGEPSARWLPPDAVRDAVREKLRWSSKRGRHR